MAMGRLKYTHLILMLGVSLLIPLFMAYSLYVDLSGTALLSSDMSFEDLEDEGLSTIQHEFKVLVPPAFSILLPWVHHFCTESSLFSSPPTSHAQITPILRC